MSSRLDLPIAIYYEQPNWFKPLFTELDKRGTNYVKLNAVEHSYGPGDKPEEKYALVLNKMSPSAWNRGHGDQIFYTLGFLEHLESRGVRVVNGVKAYRSELSKATQLAMLEGLGLGYPKARVIHRASASGCSASPRGPCRRSPGTPCSGRGTPGRSWRSSSATARRPRARVRAGSRAGCRSGGTRPRARRPSSQTTVRQCPARRSIRPPLPRTRVSGTRSYPA